MLDLCLTAALEGLDVSIAGVANGIPEAHRRLHAQLLDEELTVLCNVGRKPQKGGE